MNHYEGFVLDTAQRYNQGILKLMEGAENNDIEGQVKKYVRSIKHLIRRCEPFTPKTVKSLLNKNFDELKKRKETVAKKQIGEKEKSDEILTLEYVFYDRAFPIVQKVMNNSPIISKEMDAILELGGTMDELRAAGEKVRSSEKLDFFEEGE